MSMDGISHIGVFPQDIIISAGKTKTALAYANKNINLLTVRISPIMKDYKIIKNLLEDNNFLLSGMTKKEYLNNDLENYVLYILDEEC